jgi:hypothetical protein
VNIVAVYPAACLSAALATAASMPFWRRWCLAAGPWTIRAIAKSTPARFPWPGAWR